MPGFHLIASLIAEIENYWTSVEKMMAQLVLAVGNIEPPKFKVSQMLSASLLSFCRIFSLEKTELEISTQGCRFTCSPSFPLSSCVTSAPFQRLLCSHTGHKKVAAMAEHLAPVGNINSRLPNELLTIICQFLPFDDLRNALLVCRYAQHKKILSGKIIKNRIKSCYFCSI